MDFGDLKDGPRPPGEVFIERRIDFWNRQVDAIDPHGTNRSPKRRALRIGTWKPGSVRSDAASFSVQAQMKVKSMLELPADAYSWAMKDVDGPWAGSALRLDGRLSLADARSQRVIQRQSSGRVSRWEKDCGVPRRALRLSERPSSGRLWTSRRSSRRMELIRQFRRRTSPPSIILPSVRYAPTTSIRIPICRAGSVW